MRKPAFLHMRKQTHISFTVTAKLISAFVFATRILQSLYFLNPKFQASIHLWLYRNPEDRFSHNEAHITSKPHHRNRHNNKLAASKAYSIPTAKCRSKSGKFVKNYFFSIKLLHAHLQYICNIPFLH